ncbi:MAG TPA: hypothetical protein VLG66_06735 [Alphaproteobacteria bacterium]|nr:hypothetical protein [Alphaproteobacteria bacterium]
MGLPGLAAAQPALFAIEMNGTPGMRYIGNCTFDGAPNGQTYVKFDGFVPDGLSIAAARISCAVQKFDSFGRLEVTLFHDDEPIAFAETSAPFNWVEVWSRGYGEVPGARRGLTPLFRVNPPPGSPPPKPQPAPKARSPTPVPPFPNAQNPPPLDPRSTKPR